MPCFFMVKMRWELSSRASLKFNEPRNFWEKHIKFIDFIFRSMGSYFNFSFSPISPFIRILH